MKKVIYSVFGILLSLLLLTSCHEITVGYLMTQDANYTLDSLIIKPFPIQYATLEVLDKVYREKVGGQKVIDEYFEKMGQLENLETKLYDLEDAYYGAEDAYYEAFDEGASQSELDVLEQTMNDAYDEYTAYQEETYDPVNDRIDDIYWEFLTVAKDMELYDMFRSFIDFNTFKSTPDFIVKKIELLKQQEAEKIPWSTATIEGVLGTQPITYSIKKVEGPSAEAVAKFIPYLSVMGGGRLVISGDLDAPIGRYSISLQVKNEGYTKDLDNIFTIILSDSVE